MSIMVTWIDGLRGTICHPEADERALVACPNKGW